ncbi:carboxylesterase family protein [Streptomyces sp. GESEQ-4]|uniref:carboxylesterase family protein n=1 Tax=Streptomyces sp. GESEQ-4 TaxID=2812655 RepID=UPI001B33AF1D|nr:carboxylesterase family protein [Streptomyces sp. GESEQ-4]
MPPTGSAIVTTTSGPIRGRTHAYGTSYLSVNRAPPAGGARFTEPRPHHGWTEIRDATQPGPAALILNGRSLPDDVGSSSA